MHLVQKKGSYWVQFIRNYIVPPLCIHMQWTISQIQIKLFCMSQVLSIWKLHNSTHPYLYPQRHTQDYMYQAVSVFYTANDKSIKVVWISSLLLPYTYMDPQRNVSVLMVIQCTDDDTVYLHPTFQGGIWPHACWPWRVWCIGTRGKGPDIDPQPGRHFYVASVRVNGRTVPHSIQQVRMNYSTKVSKIFYCYEIWMASFTMETGGQKDHVMQSASSAA